ncbi:MAG TPA: cytochrome c family protein [Sphingomicrobium sp.]|nr:cytochrome c family protein [Sphingomicrobium sp.]
MNDRFNTIAGWVLFAGIVALGGSVLSAELFKGHEIHGGYPVEGAQVEGAAATADEKPIEFYLASADAAKGEQVFKKCAACHNADPGGANALGPALYGVMGNGIATHPGFAFTDALKSKGGTWDWKTMSEWLTSPKKFAPGTKMTFAGLSNPQDRANVMAFLNLRDTAPLPLPTAPAEAPATAGAAAADSTPKPGTGPGDGPQKAENEPQGATPPSQ